MGLPHSQKEKWIRPAVHMRTTQRELHAAWSKKNSQGTKKWNKARGYKKEAAKKRGRRERETS